MPDHQESASKHGQRFGQFINNAIKDYLNTSGRETTDFEVGQSLFFFSDSDLDKVLDTYARLLDARSPIGFGASKAPAERGE